MAFSNALSGQKTLSTLLTTRLLAVALLTTALLCSLPSMAKESFSIYLVRHAEKQTEGENPSLTTCGLFRAKQLASLLSNANITNVYSTSYQRTMQTAQPLATLNTLPIKNYNPRYLDQLAVSLKTSQENTLIVGHSNTTPTLTALLSDQKVAALTEDDYQFLYQIQFIGDQKILTLFKQPLICEY